MQFHREFRELHVGASLVERLQLQLHLAAVHVNTARWPHEGNFDAGCCGLIIRQKMRKEGTGLAPYRLSIQFHEIFDTDL